MDWYWDALENASPEEVASRLERAIGAGADPNDQSMAGCTPLYWAASDGMLAIAEQLIRLGARPDAEVRGDETSLHAVAERRDHRMLATLLAAPCKAIIDRFDYVSRTPLMVAADVNDLACARLLLNAGANVNAHDKKRGGDTALKLAAQNGHASTARLLVEAGADPTIPGWMGRTAIHCAQELDNGPRHEMLALLKRASGLCGSDWERQLLPDRPSG